MTPDELNKILDAVKPKEKSENIKMTELFFKAITTASLALVVWLFSNVSEMQKDIVEIKSDVNYTKENVAKIEGFAASPRYTQKDHDSDVLPILNSLERISNNMRNLDSQEGEMEKELAGIRTRLQILELKVK